MIHFGKISQQQFLREYWQKKPLLIKQALPNFISPITPDELAGLSLEKEFESRLITGSIDSKKWSLRNGPFIEQDFLATHSNPNLTQQDWTLLIQGVDRHIDAVHNLITEFDFIPRWRFDDVMISYATIGGSVGPHFDHYDVFLLQGTGKRRWHISTQDCELDNYLKSVPLRIMDKFNTEQTFDVVPGDVLYIPPKIAHHGISLDNNCTTLSFGYRAYSTQELFEFIDKPCSNKLTDTYYQDPQWDNTEQPALIPDSAIQQAQTLLGIDAVQFAKFVTKLDILDIQNLQLFKYNNQDECFDSQSNYQLHPVCKIAYLQENDSVKVFINGEEIKFNGANNKVLMDFCDKRTANQLRYPKLFKQLFDQNIILSI